jgi:hypothetical protein
MVPAVLSLLLLLLLVLLLDKESRRCFGVSEKPRDTSRNEQARNKRKAKDDVRVTAGHQQSWADVVKSRPQSHRKASLQPIKQ